MNAKLQISTLGKSARFACAAGLFLTAVTMAIPALAQATDVYTISKALTDNCQRLSSPADTSCTFSITITNAGAKTHSTPVTIYDELSPFPWPTGAVVSVTATAAVTGSNSATPPVSCVVYQPSSGSFRCNSAPVTMAPGDVMIMTLAMTINWHVPTNPAWRKNCAQLEDPVPTNFACVTAESPDVEIQKTATAGDWVVGQPYNFTLTFNAGPQDLPAGTIITVRDGFNWSAGGVFNQGSPLTAVSMVGFPTGTAWTCNSYIICTYTVPAGSVLAAGATATITITVIPWKATTAGNTSTVALSGLPSGQSETKLSNNTFATKVRVISYNLTIDKTAEKKTWAPGSTHHPFRLKVTNGASAIPATTPVSIMEMVPWGLTVTLVTGTPWDCTDQNGNHVATVVGAAPIRCTYKGSYPIAAGQVLPVLVMFADRHMTYNATATIRNCAHVALGQAQVSTDSCIDLAPK